MNPTQAGATEEAEFLQDIELQLNNQAFYERRYNTHRPKFKGRPADYYPNTWGNVILIWILIISNYVLWFGLFAGFVAFLIYCGEAAVWTYFGVWVFYVTFILLIVYRGSKVRAKTEKRMIEEKVKQQKAEQEKHAQAAATTAPAN